MLSTVYLGLLILHVQGWSAPQRASRHPLGACRMREGTLVGDGLP